MNLELRKSSLAAAFVVAFLVLLAIAPRQTHATFPGRPGEIVFNLVTQQGAGDYTGGLYAIDPGQDQPRQLTSNPWDFDPSFAPFPRILVFRRTHSPRSGIYLLDLKDATTKRITSVGSDLDPTFVPRGVVFSRFFEGSAYDLVFKELPGQPLRLTSGPARDEESVVTPNGKRVVFSRRLGKTRALYSIGTDGRDLRLIAKVPLLTDNLDISPNGRRVIYDVLEEGPDGGPEFLIWSRRLDGGGLKLVSKNAAFPTYSPDGDTVAYTNFEGLWTRPADGRGPRRLVFPATSANGEGSQATQPAWQQLP